jgi:hypothetical protein
MFTPCAVKLIFLTIFLQGPKEIKEDDRIKIEVGDGEIVLVCRAAEKGDQGKYAVTLKNPKGSDTAQINVVVLDKPGAPEGPLEVSKVTPESCKLAWHAPKVAKYFYHV